MVREPNESDVRKAREVRDAIKAAGWRYTFKPLNKYGERVELKDPGNAGRLTPEIRAKWRNYKWAVEILAERSYALQKLKIKQGDAYVDSDASRFASRAIELFPGLRVCFV